MPVDALYAKGFTQRLLFFAGGVAMNVLFALIVFPIIFLRRRAVRRPGRRQRHPGSPAWEARVEPGDRIVSDR
jgi:membrane-associated protease RseP (regulator of RpoE activity)